MDPQEDGQENPKRSKPETISAREIKVKHRGSIPAWLSRLLFPLRRVNEPDRNPRPPVEHGIKLKIFPWTAGQGYGPT